MDAIDELARLGHAEVVTVEPGATRWSARDRAAPAAGLGDFVGFVGFGTVLSQVLASVAERERPTNQANAPRDATAAGSVTKPPDHAQNAVTKPVTNRDEPARAGVTKPVTNRDKTPSEEPVREVPDATGEWARPCRDYTAHWSSHRNTAAGWTCDACYPEDAA